MVDIDLLVKTLKQRGHTVDSLIPVPENAGLYELQIDGNYLTLDEARSLLEQESQ
jgi:hypothetical protein